MKKKCLVLFLMSMIFFSCSHVNYKIDDKSYQAKGKDNRIKYIVLHYTATNDEVGIRALTGPNVSSHYLVTSKAEEPTYALVPHEERAWHAGVSEFGGRSNINDTSIGIEIVNIGIKAIPDAPKYDGFFRPYDEYVEFDDAQIRKVAALLKTLIEQYQIKPKFYLIFLFSLSLLIIFQAVLSQFFLLLPAPVYPSFPEIQTWTHTQYYRLRLSVHLLLTAYLQNPCLLRFQRFHQNQHLLLPLQGADESLHRIFLLHLTTVDLQCNGNLRSD